jgi:hypothetical protein
MSINLGPKDLLYKSVVDALGVTVGKVVNMTQNGSGNFDLFGVAMDPDASIKMNHGHQRTSEPVFLDVELIERIDRVVKLKKRLEDLLDD